MPCLSRPTVLSLAVLAAMFAFGASAQERPASQPPENNQSEQPGRAASDKADQTGQDASLDQVAGPQDSGGDRQPAAKDTAPLEVADQSSDFANAGDIDALEPYKLMRSLQFVQDAVVGGDHSAMEMQRFLLGVIDNRLRTADQKVFDDPRNVDAALIYAMSGGNPETLDILAMKDKFGNFDNEVTTVLRAYLNGRAASAQKTLTEVVALYRESEIGPYLTLVAANVTAAMNDAAALELFDLARLMAPGTLVEEAALRRSLFIAARKNMVDEALYYAQLYARRFINSPYAGQYADLLVDLVVLNYGKVGDDRLNQILSFMDRPRKREVYLRIARKAVISGLRDLAVFASERAETLLSPSDTAPQALADLYSGMARIPTDGVGDVLAGINAISEQQLSPRDRALREAARIIAVEVMRQPDPNSLTQAFSPMMNGPDEAGGKEARAQASKVEAKANPSNASLATSSGGEAATKFDEAFKGYVSDRKQTLERIDQLLEGVNKEIKS